MRISKFSALTFDCYGTLIDWERGMLSALTPWHERSGLEMDENILLASYGRHETAIQQEQPGLPYNTVVANVLGRIADEFGIPAQQNEMQVFGNSVGLWPSFADSRDAPRRHAWCRNDRRSLFSPSQHRCADHLGGESRLEYFVTLVG